MTDINAKGKGVSIAALGQTEQHQRTRTTVSGKPRPPKDVLAEAQFTEIMEIIRVGKYFLDRNDILFTKYYRFLKIVFNRTTSVSLGTKPTFIQSKATSAPQVLSGRGELSCCLVLSRL